MFVQSEPDLGGARCGERGCGEHLGGPGCIGFGWAAVVAASERTSGECADDEAEQSYRGECTRHGFRSLLAVRPLLLLPELSGSASNNG